MDELPRGELQQRERVGLPCHSRGRQSFLVSKAGRHAHWLVNAAVFVSLQDRVANQTPLACSIVEFNVQVLPMRCDKTVLREKLDETAPAWVPLS